MKSVSKGSEPIKRGKDSWFSRFNVTDELGNTKRVGKTVRCRTKTEAKRLFDEIRMDLMASDAPIIKEDITLGEYLKGHLEYLHDVKHLSPNTLRGYRDIVETRWVPRLGAVRLKDIKPYMIEDQLAWMRKSGGEGGKPLSGNTCQKALSFLKTALKRAQMLEYIPGNPCDAVDAPSRERKEVKVIDEGEVQRMKIALLGHPDVRFAAAVSLTLDTGMRRGEVCALRWQDIDLEAGIVHVRHALAEAKSSDTYNGETIDVKTPKSSRSNRDITTPEGTVAMLAQYRQLQRYRLLYNDIEQGEETPVFCSDLGELYRPSKLTSDFSRFTQQKRFDVTFHGLRHTHASLLLKQGVPIQYVSMRLGHESIEITYKTYSHFLPGDDGGSADAWSKLAALPCAVPTMLPAA